MTITNQVNPVGSSYTSKKSYVAVPREGNPFIKETTFTTLRLTKTTNNPPTYRKEIFQHSSAKDEGNVVQIGTINEDGDIEFNTQLDSGNGNEELMKEQIQKDLQNMMNNAVNIERLQKDMDKALADIEELKDKIRSVKNGNDHGGQ